MSIVLLYQACLFHLFVPGVVFGQAGQVFNNYKETFRNPDVCKFFPPVLRAFKTAPSLLLKPFIIEKFVENPRNIWGLYEKTDESILRLLLFDEEFRALFTDGQFHALVRSPTQIDKLVKFIGTLECQDDEEDSEPRTLSIISGNSQEGKPGAPLANPFVVEVRQDGKVLSGVSVTFRVTTEGGGTLSPTTARTDNVGRAATILTLGSSAGAHWVEASAAGITQSQTFTATAKEAIPPPDPPPTLWIVSGNSQEGKPGAPLANPFVVEVRQDGKVLSGVSVTFRVTTEGGGTLSPTTARTDNVGRAATILTLGSSAGAHWVEASAAGITQSQTFTATAKEAIPPPDPPPTLWIVSGNSQEGKPGAPLANPFVVEVRQDGKVLSGVSVTFRVTTEGGGTLSPTTARTDNVGRAATILTLGSSAGAHWVEASAAGITQSQTFTATAAPVVSEASKATTLLIRGNGQEGSPGTRLQPFVVEVRDKDDNRVPNVGVYFRVTAGSGALSDETTITGENGRAETMLTLGSVPGEISVEAEVAGTSLKRNFTAMVNVPPSVYWIADGRLYRSTIGSGEEEPLVQSVENATSLAVDMKGNKIYWTEQTSDSTGRIRSANLDGTGVRDIKDLTWCAA